MSETKSKGGCVLKDWIMLSAKFHVVVQAAIQLQCCFSSHVRTVSESFASFLLMHGVRLSVCGASMDPGVNFVAK
eukprot:gene4480-3273_t